MNSQIILTLIILLSLNLAYSKSNIRNTAVTCNYSYLNNKNTTTPSPQNLLVLGKAAVYAVLAYATTTNSGPTTIVGNIGVSPGSAIAGLPVTLIGGTQHSADQNALDAQNAATNAYNKILILTNAKDLTGIDLVNLVLLPGRYKFSSSAFLSASGFLTLDAKGNAKAEWYFQIGSTLISSVGAEVRVINGGSALNVYWQVGSSATIKGSTNMVGNIIALASITFGTSANLIGRAYALNGAITMLSNTIASALCKNN